MKPHRELEISQKSAGFMLHRLHKTAEMGSGPFAGPVEVDETYMGGKRRNLFRHKHEELTSWGAVGETAVAWAKNRVTMKVAANAAESTDQEMLEGLVSKVTDESERVYTYKALTAENRLPSGARAV